MKACTITFDMSWNYFFTSFLSRKRPTAVARDRVHHLVCCVLYVSHLACSPTVPDVASGVLAPGPGGDLLVFFFFQKPASFIRGPGKKNRTGNLNCKSIAAAFSTRTLESFLSFDCFLVP